jgi:hypothetical protein
LVGLVKAAKAAGIIPNTTERSLGRQAINHVLECYPTLYVKLLDTCNLINWYYVDHLKADPPIAKDEIIVCGFRLRDFTKLPNLLGLSLSDIALGSGVRLQFVESLHAKYRVHLDPVLKIHDFLVTEARKLPIKADESPDLTRLRIGRIEQGVAIDDSTYLNIQKIPDPYDKTKDVYLLDSSNIEKAPREGHPWAIGPAPGLPPPTAGTETKI